MCFAQLLICNRHPQFSRAHSLIKDLMSRLSQRFLRKSQTSNSILYWITAEGLSCITFWHRCDFFFFLKKNLKNAQSSPGQQLASRCEYIMPVSEVHAEVTDKAGPTGPVPDQLSFIVSIWLSVGPCRPPLDEMQADSINV